MPSSLPRLSVVVTPEQHQLLSELSTLQSRSASSYMRHLLDLATPSLRRILGPLTEARDEEAEFDEAFADEVAELLLEAEEDLTDQLALFDLEDHTPAEQDGSAETARTAAKRGPQPGPAEPSLPPYSNTGVRNPEQGGSNVAILRVRAR